MYDFELEMYRRMNARIYTFDPFLNTTQKEAIMGQSYINFFELGLAGTRDIGKYRSRNPKQVGA